jgi:hypothetical protein
LSQVAGRFQSPSLRGVARDVPLHCTSSRPWLFQSPSLRGVARDKCRCHCALLGGSSPVVSVPFSSGCRARHITSVAPGDHPPHSHVSVPFSSGCRARPDLRSYRYWCFALGVSVPFSSGCRARLTARRSPGGWPATRFSPLLFGVSRATMDVKSYRRFRARARARDPRSAGFSPLLFGVSRATSTSSDCPAILYIVFQSPSLRGVARDAIRNRLAMIRRFIVSVPFSSGCRARRKPPLPTMPPRRDCFSPLLFGVSRATRGIWKWSIPLLPSVSVPFSSGCRARRRCCRLDRRSTRLQSFQSPSLRGVARDGVAANGDPFAGASERRLIDVSVPFSSGCRARLACVAILPVPARSTVSVPFSSGCRARPRRADRRVGAASLLFQSPSLRGVARDCARADRVAFQLAVYQNYRVAPQPIRVSVPFSSGCRARRQSRSPNRSQPSLPGVARDGVWLVSVPFSSGCRARRTGPGLTRPVSVPFSSGCRARLSLRACRRWSCACPRSFQSPSLRGVARDAHGAVTRPAFQSPSLRGVARECSTPSCAEACAEVSVPFSSGCRARHAGTPVVITVGARAAVSVPFSSGCRARRQRSGAAAVAVPFSGVRARQMNWRVLYIDVSVPFSSGCRARRPDVPQSAPSPVIRLIGFSPLLFGVSRAT